MSAGEQPGVKDLPSEAGAMGVRRPIRADALMPAAPAERSLLIERAEHYARDEVRREDLGPLCEFLVVRLGGGCYGIPFELLDEILDRGAITPVPGTPAHIAGIVNRRGELLSVFDLHAMFGLAAPAGSGPTPVVVLRRPYVVGLRVEAIEGSDSCPSQALTAGLSASDAARPACVIGIHARHIAVIDFESLLADPTWIVDHPRGSDER